MAPPTERWALRSWILTPYRGTGVQVGHRACERKPNALCSPPTPTPLTGSAEPWPHCSDLGPSLCPLGLNSHPCNALGMSCTGVHPVGWGLTTRVGLTATTGTFPLCSSAPSGCPEQCHGQIALEIRKVFKEALFISSRERDRRVTFLGQITTEFFSR